MKRAFHVTNLFVICALLMTLLGVSGSAAVIAAPEAPGSPDAIMAQMPPPIRQWAGLQRSDNAAADPDIYPQPPSTVEPNEPTVLGAVPDTAGAAGYTHYLQAVNKMLALYLKDGTLVEMSSFQALWTFAAASIPAPPATACTTPTAHHGQPQVLYDHLNLRWVVSDVAYENVDNGPYYVCIAVSKANAPIVTPPAPPYPWPAGTYFNNTNWFFYAISTNEGNLHYYPDSPKLSLWGDGYYLAADLFDVYNNGLNRTPRGVKVWAINRADLSAGLVNTFRYVPKYLPEQMDYEHLVPTNLLGTPAAIGTPNYFASIQPGRFHIWEFRVNWQNMGLSTFGNNLMANYTLTTDTSTSWINGYVVPQPYTDERVDAHGERLMTPIQYRIVDGVPSLWASHTLESNNVTGVRWYEIQFATNGAPNFTQTGIHQPDTKYRWMSSLAVDRAGNMAVGYSISAPTAYCGNGCVVYPSIYYAGRLRGDPQNTLPLTENALYRGEGSQFDYAPTDDDGPDGPWGRQSQMSIDPLDDCVFWYTNMYYDAPLQGATNNINWRTRIGFFALKQCRGGNNQRISLSTQNDQGNKASGEDYEMFGQTVSINTTGRYVAFSSEATNLVSNDTNGKRDIFVRDRDTDGDGIYDEPDAVQTACISCTGNGDSWEVSISGTGRYIAFSSFSDNLVPGDTNAAKDVFMFDRQTNIMRRISSPDGNANGNGFGESDQPFISGNGEYVAFRSVAPNLVTGDTNSVADIFVRRWAFNQTRRVSLNPPAIPVRQLTGESMTPSLTWDGRYVVFASRDPLLAPNSVPAFADANLDPTNPLAPVGSGLDVFLANWSTGAVTPVSYIEGVMSMGDLESFSPFIATEGRQIAFASRATNMFVTPDTNGYADIYVWDTTQRDALNRGIITKVSTNFFGGEAINGDSYAPSLSANGQYVTFASDATNLDAFLPDLNGLRDVFLHDRGLSAFGIYDVGLTTRISLDYNRSEANDWSLAPMISGNGQYVAYASEASDLVTNDTNAVWDIFSFDNMRTVPTFLRIQGGIPASPGGTVSVPISFQANGYSIDSLAFSVDYDQVCLEFDPALPNAVIFNVPAAFTSSYTFNAADTNGELDFNIYDAVAPLSGLPDTANLVTVTYRVRSGCAADLGMSNTSYVNFSATPRPSYGSNGLSILGSNVNGFVVIGQGLPGDCSGDGVVDANDLSHIVLEIFDGDGNLPADTPKPTHYGNPIGCNPNHDIVVDSGDISCTVLVIFGSGHAACAGTAMSAAPEFPTLPKANVSLSVPANVPAKPGRQVVVPVTLNPQGNAVNSLAFSLDYDDSWLSFDDTDANSDGVPDAIQYNLPSGFTPGVSFNAADKNGELDFAVFNAAVPLSQLPAGTIAYVSLDVIEQPGEFLAQVLFSGNPAASFGSTNGVSLPGSAQSGSVWISNMVMELFLPFIMR